MTRIARGFDEAPARPVPWRVLAFTDLHVSARTLDRAVVVLREVREHALRRGATHIVCLGDFWDARGSLNVRQLDAVLDELHRWRDARIPAVLIPGNHDQVSLSGRVHGIRFAEAFPNVAVATEPLLWAEHRVAFLPWREDPSAQAALFDLPGEGWTVFAHAEVTGAVTNGRHTAAGRVGLEQIARHCRACYVGHYHRRQRLGDRTWYLGSPFEHNFGEAGDPKGLALITPDRAEPEWIPLEGFPRHHRVTLGASPPALAPHDIVELLAPREAIGTAAVADAAKALGVRDVRVLPRPAEDGGGKVEPAYALTLDQAVAAYVAQEAAAAEQAGADLVTGVTVEQLLAIGKGILSEIPEARASAPFSARCSLVGLEVEGFCALRERVQLDLDKRGLVLIRGAVGNGKTALVDAITWCLTDRTSPRRAGSATATFRGDELINDHCQSCSVTVRIRLADDREVVVTRSKARGKGAQLSVTGITGLEVGVAKDDHAALVARLVGLDHDLWRSCVSLGQGTVANFVTDADKRRKDQLAVAFGLTACPEAVAFVRSRLKPLRFSIDKAKLDLAAEQRAYEEVARVNYSEQIRAYEDQRAVMMAQAQHDGEVAKDLVARSQAVLDTEASWQADLARVRSEESELVSQLAQVAAGSRDMEAERASARLSGEQQAVRATVGAARRALDAARASAAGGVCPTCGQATAPTHTEQHVAAARAHLAEVERRATQIEEDLRAASAAMQATQRASEDQRRALEAAVAQARGRTSATLSHAVGFATARAQQQAAVRRLEESRAAWVRAKDAVNPHVAQQQAANERAVTLLGKIDGLRAQIATIEAQIAGFLFWETAFGPSGVPVLVLRTALYEIETHANRFLGMLLGGRILVQLAIDGDDLAIRYFETRGGETRERRYEQLSGGQRRCVEMAFTPFALGEMIFARLGVRVPFLVVDELTTHLGADEKPLMCELLRTLERETVLVIDHDAGVQGEFDLVYDLTQGPTALSRVTA